jgi:type IV pilus assembly protein PilB
MPQETQIKQNTNNNQTLNVAATQASQNTANLQSASVVPSSQPQGNSNADNNFSATGVVSILLQAKVVAVSKNKKIEDVLQDQKKISEDALYKAKATVEGYKFTNVSTIEIPIETLNRISKDIAQKQMAVTFGEDEGKVQVAITDPGDLQKTKFLRIVIGKPIDVYLSSPGQIQSVIDNQYGGRITEEVEEALEDVQDVVQLSSRALSAEDVSKESFDSAPVSRIVNMILEYAVKYKASDVHIEPRENKVVVRFRISGILAEKLSLPKKLVAAVISRIKILSNLKIDEHRLPQDGRFQIRMANIYFDLRVSVMPSVYGEKVVMRLLPRGGGQMTLEDTGLRGYALRSFRESIKRTEGIILVTGPTGSGKTHTLASCLKILNRPDVNIQTLEDPVEIRVDGVTQVQVNPEIGLTFATGLRSFLRQDPDIMMVGEVRDPETASLATQAALTGHLVLTTLHTNSAAGALPRLLDMGVEAYLLASTMNCVLAQRLVRKVCEHCKQSYAASKPEIIQLHKVLDGLKGFDLYSYPPRRDNTGGSTQSTQNQTAQKNIILYKGGGEGCSKCSGTGYSSRIGIFEVLLISEKVGQMIMEHRSAYEVNYQAKSDGMITMIQDGFLKALDGITTIEEVLRVTN